MMYAPENWESGIIDREKARLGDIRRYAYQRKVYASDVSRIENRSMNLHSEHPYTSRPAKQRLREFKIQKLKTYTCQYDV
ncbi:hypothetical protein AAMO2058_001744100 [Amorphochlora amoebiformis]